MKTAFHGTSGILDNTVLEYFLSTSLQDTRKGGHWGRCYLLLLLKKKIQNIFPNLSVSLWFYSSGPMSFLHDFCVMEIKLKEGVWARRFLSFLLLLWHRRHGPILNLLAASVGRTAHLHAGADCRKVKWEKTSNARLREQEEVVGRPDKQITYAGRNQSWSPIERTSKIWIHSSLTGADHGYEAESFQDWSWAHWIPAVASWVCMGIHG